MNYDPDACHGLIIAVIARHMRDLHSCRRRKSALYWLGYIRTAEYSQAELWCEYSMDVNHDALLDRIELALDRPAVDYGARRRGK